MSTARTIRLLVIDILHDLSTGSRAGFYGDPAEDHDSPAHQTLSLYFRHAKDPFAVCCPYGEPYRINDQSPNAARRQLGQAAPNGTHLTAANTTVDPPDDIGYPTDVSSPDALQFGMELARIASDNKSSDVVVLDLRGISQVTDFTVIATGTSNRQMRAVVDAAIEYGKKVGQRPYGCAGYESASWIVIDYVDVVFHVFIQSFREYYDLELLWGDAPRIAWAKSESA